MVCSAISGEEVYALMVIVIYVNPLPPYAHGKKSFMDTVLADVMAAEENVQQ